MDRNTLTLVLAGGQGTRLAPLTRYRSKPAVRFGGIARLVDFALANCANSGLARVLALTQNQSFGLQRHLATVWEPVFERAYGGFLEPVAAPHRSGQSRGTADVVRQTLHLVDDVDPDVVLIVPADHVACLDFGPLLAFHREQGCGVTVACVRVPLEEAAGHHSVLEVDDEQRLVGWSEKPVEPHPLPSDPACCLVSLDIYAFSKTALARALWQTLSRNDPHADLGRHVLPHLLCTTAIATYEFATSATGGLPYWKPVTTLDSYYEAHRDLLLPAPFVELDDPAWPILGELDVAAPIALQREPLWGSPHAEPGNLIAENARIAGEVSRSLIGPGCVIEAGAVVEDSILTHGVIVGRDAVVSRAILDDHVHVEPGAHVGVDHDLDWSRGLTVSPHHVVAAPAFHLIFGKPEWEPRTHRPRYDDSRAGTIAVR
jgi:glucose-1-phosphate adenylyltransferase